MAYVNNPVTWVGVAVRTADGKLVTYEIGSELLTNVTIERSVDVEDDWPASAEAGYMIRKPGEFEHVDIRISGSARRWRDYPGSGRPDEIEPAVKAIGSGGSR